MMKKVTTTITIIVLAAIFMFRNGILTEQHTKGKSTIKTILSGNKIIYKDLVLNDSEISPGFSPGKITVTGDFTMSNSATYKCELKDLTGAGTGHDQIDVSGNTTLDGTLNIVLDGYSPNNADMFDIIKYGGTLSGTFSTITGMPSGWQIDYGVITSGKVTIYGPNSTLPVELLNFKAQKDKGQVLLTWQTVSEKDINYFIVENSTDAEIFATLERVKAQGESDTINNYIVTDRNPAKGINYYRLKQVNLDGGFTYSNIISVTMDSSVFAFYPNPATKTISFNKPVRSATILDMQGREVLKSQDINSNLNISALKPGIYIIDINKGEYKGKLIVE